MEQLKKLDFQKAEAEDIAAAIADAVSALGFAAKANPHGAGGAGGAGGVEGVEGAPATVVDVSKAALQRKHSQNTISFRQSGEGMGEGATQREST